jgi:AraC-like DNA-binding protein
MAKQTSARKTSTQDLQIDLKSSAKTDAVPFRQVLDQLGKTITFTEAIIVTTLPRGTLQIAQPPKLPEALLKEYQREYHFEDRLTWQTILNERPMSAVEVWSNAADSRYIREFLRGNNLRYGAAAPLQAPVVEGYPGALHLYRTEEQGLFSRDEVQKLGAFARQLDAMIEKAHAARPKVASCFANMCLTNRPKVRQFIFDGQLRELYAGDEYQALDQRLRDQLVEYAKRELHKLNGQLTIVDRIKIPDSRGDLWTFRVVTYRQYPAIGEGPFVLFCLQPNCGEWGNIRPSDLQADAELSRLIPALKFMKQEFRRGPTLGEIAKTVHLSPFHFHRRFTELLGLTPKAYLLECQIQDAKVQLVARKKDLAQIAADCGFAHQSHFTSRFKQATGLTPTRWRRLATEAKRQAPMTG